MEEVLYVCAATAALALSARSGHALSINIGAGVKPALDATDVIQKAAAHIVEGRRYCFYFDGWHGAGGWGGEYGWQGLELRTRGKALRARVDIRQTRTPINC